MLIQLDCWWRRDAKVRILTFPLFSGIERKKRKKMNIIACSFLFFKWYLGNGLKYQGWLAFHSVFFSTMKVIASK